MDRSIGFVVVLLGVLFCGEGEFLFSQKGFQIVRESPFLLSHFEFLGFPDHR